MSNATSLRQGFTVRLDPQVQERVRRISDAEHRSVSAYLEQLVARDLASRDEAERVVRVFVDPAVGGIPQAEVAQEAGEDEERYARRAATLDKLFGTGH